MISEGVNYEEIDAKDPETLTEVEKIALLGRPKLGDITKVQIRIKESKEFKVHFYPRGRPTVMAGSDHYFCTWCPSVLTLQNLTKQNKFKVRIVIAIGETVCLAEGSLMALMVLYWFFSKDKNITCYCLRKISCQFLLAKISSK